MDKAARNLGIALVAIVAAIWAAYTINSEDGTISRKWARKVCTNVCQEVNKVVLSAINEKGVLADDGTYEGLIEIVDKTCKHDCEGDIALDKHPVRE